VLKTSENGSTILDFTYGDGRGWPAAADGGGHSLVSLPDALARHAEGALDYGRHWRASAVIGGSPGTADTAWPPSLILNEFCANADLTEDWIELYNQSNEAVSLQDWYLSDDFDNLKKWPLPNLSIHGQGHLAVYPTGFALSRNGEAVILSYLPGKANVDRVVDAIRFQAQETNQSLGRDPDASPDWATMTPTRDQSNAPGIVSIGIDEVMYHPTAQPGSTETTAGEYLELSNPAEAAVPLWNEIGSWRLSGGIDFVFPAGSMIPAQGRLLVVGFDPSDATARDAFLSQYSLPAADVELTGPYTGQLSNRGDRITLEKPFGIDPADRTVYWVVMDEVIYFDQDPWPSEADGEGKVLQRIQQARPGNDPSNWHAGDPTPGKTAPPYSAIGDWMLH
jgi:hypothetical protein